MDNSTTIHDAHDTSTSSGTSGVVFNCCGHDLHHDSVTDVVLCKKCFKVWGGNSPCYINVPYIPPTTTPYVPYLPYPWWNGGTTSGTSPTTIATPTTS